MSCKVFVEHFDFCLEGLNPKCIRIPRNIIVEEVHKYFGPMHKKNGYNYVFSEDPEVIAKVEGLWMVINHFFRYGKRHCDGVKREKNELGDVC
jgi:hypothetical protein